MNRRLFAITLMTLLATLLIVGGATGQGPDLEPEGGVRPRGDVSVAATVNSLISYQGMLTEDGSPVTGERDMTFRLYSDNSCSTQVGSDIVRNGVPVHGGLFSVKLNVSQRHFDGRGLWLGVDVGNTGANVVCDEILPVPYALSLRPGAVISTTGYPALHAESTNPSGRGLRGYATATSGTNYGVVGASRSPNGYGGYFYNNADDETSTGAGVYGQGAIYGVRGKATLSSWSGDFPPPIYGVYGEAVDLPGFATGVYGKANTGVHGYGTTNNGVVGYAAATSGIAHGVYGHTNSTNGAGVFALGAEGGADLILGGNADTTQGDDGRISSHPTYASSDIYLVSNDTVRIDLDNDGDGEDADFEIRDKDNILIFNVDESGTTNIRGNLVLQSSSTGATIIELGEGLDYAEGFNVSDKAGIGPGAVLIIDPDHPGELGISDTPYDTRVAGIVAGANGMGSAVRLGVGQFDYDVALAGRVYCNVDATETGVEPGDLLTTSAIPGYAMKATNYARAQGAILGKAMERLEKGEKGQILVLVTLQ